MSHLIELIKPFSGTLTAFGAVGEILKPVLSSGNLSM